MIEFTIHEVNMFLQMKKMLILLMTGRQLNT